MRTNIFRSIACFLGGTILFCSTAFGQEKTISVGVKGGLNVANVYDSLTKGFYGNPKLGFALGGFLTIPLGGAVAIQPEVFYSQKGYTATLGIGASSYKISQTYNYLDIPVLLVLRMSDKVSLVVGPQINFLLSSKYKFTQGKVSADEEKKYKTSLRTNTFAGHLGFDFNFEQITVSPRVSVDAQENKSTGTTSNNLRFRNVLLQLTVAYRL